MLIAVSAACDFGFLFLLFLLLLISKVFRATTYMSAYMTPKDFYTAIGASSGDPGVFRLRHDALKLT